MRTRRATYAATAIVLGLIALALCLYRQGHEQRQWLEVMRGQLAAIERLGDVPPAGWDPATWKNAVITPYNVWGNVTYHPSYSQISLAEMRSLQAQLDQIAAEATPVNSIESVDRVFRLLLARGQKTEFIRGFHDEFRAAAK